MSSRLVSALSPVMRVNAGPGREQQRPELFFPLEPQGERTADKRCPVFWLLETEVELLYIYMSA